MDLPPPFTSLREAFADEHRSRIERYLHLTQQPADIIAAHFVELDEISRVIENDAYARYAALDADQQRLLLLFREAEYPDDQLIADYQLIFGKPISQVIQAYKLALDGNRYGYELKHGGRTRFVTSYGILGKGMSTKLASQLGLSQGERGRVLSDTWRLYDRLTTGNSPVTAKTAALYIPDYPEGRASPTQEILKALKYGYDWHRDNLIWAYFLLLVPAYLLTKFLGFIDFNLATRLLITLPMLLMLFGPFCGPYCSDSPVSRWRSIWKP